MELINRLQGHNAGRPVMGGGQKSAGSIKAVAIAGFAALAAGVVVLMSAGGSDGAAGGASAAPDVRVLVAGKTFSKGATAEALVRDDAVRVQTVPEADVAPGALRDVANLKGRVAAGEVLEGEQLTSSDFVAAGDALSAQLSAGQRAVTISLDPQHGMVGSVREGDRVDVFGAYELRQQGSGEQKQVLKELARDVPVLRAPEKAPSGRGDAGGEELVVRVEDALAPKLAFTAEYGKVWVALRPAAGAKDVRPDVVTIESILFGVKPIVVNRQLKSASKPKGNR